MSKRHAILTAVGPDRPGLVEKLAGFFRSHDCNLEDSRMAVLAGEFAIILLFSGPSAAVDKVCAEGGAVLLERLGFRATFKTAEGAAASALAPEGDASLGEGATYSLCVSGGDQPGIVHRITEAVAQRNINVSSFESRLGHAAFSGTPIFTVTAELRIPQLAAVDALRRELEKRCDSMDLTFELKRL